MLYPAALHFDSIRSCRCFFSVGNVERATHGLSVLASPTPERGRVCWNYRDGRGIRSPIFVRIEAGPTVSVLWPQAVVSDPEIRASTPSLVTWTSPERVGSDPRPRPYPGGRGAATGPHPCAAMPRYLPALQPPEASNLKGLGPVVGPSRQLLPGAEPDLVSLPSTRSRSSARSSRLRDRGFSLSLGIPL